MCVYECGRVCACVRVCVCVCALTHVYLPQDAGTSQSVAPASAASDPGEGTPVDWEDVCLYCDALEHALHQSFCRRHFARLKLILHLCVCVCLHGCVCFPQDEDGLLDWWRTVEGT